MTFKRMLLASDIDGTLYINREVSQEDAEAIKKWQEAGHLFGICSGRSVQDSIRALSESGIQPDFRLCSSGATATDCEGKFLYKRTMPIEAPRALWEIAKPFEPDAFTGHAPDGTTLHGLNAARPHYLNCKIEDLFEKELTQCYIGLHSVPGQAEEFAKKVEEGLPYINVHRNATYIDCTVKGTDKAKGVSFMAEHFGIEEENCFTVGDNQNDLPMLLAFEGYCIESGDEYTKEQVGRTTESVANLIDFLLDRAK